MLNYEIYRYVSNNSTYVINIDSKSRNLATKLFKKKESESMFEHLKTFEESKNESKMDMFEMKAIRELYHIYDTAFVSVWKLLSIDSYTRFKTTDEYLDLVKRIQEHSPR